MFSLNSAPRPKEPNETDPAEKAEGYPRMQEILSNVRTEYEPGEPIDGEDRLRAVKSLIDNHLDEGERSLLEGQFDKKAEEFFTFMTTTSVDRKNPNAKGEVMQVNISHIKDFPFYNEETRTSVLAAAEARAQSL
jgi:hypothetical protein